MEISCYGALILSCLLVVSFAYPQGAPVRQESCVNLQPIHIDPLNQQQVQNQNSENPPYVVTVNKNRYTSCTTQTPQLCRQPVIVSGFPNGAPSQNVESCLNLNPIHNNALYFSPPPYFLQTSQAFYAFCNETAQCQRRFVAARLQIQGQGANFRGFIIQARTPSGGSRSWGQFFPTQNDAKIIRCQNGLTLTHTANNDKQSVTFQWIPEPNMREQVQFVATVVQNLRTIYPRVYSRPLPAVGGKTHPLFRPIKFM
ncbi:hypothetical protein FSP39_016847 [Pinctada imbricata]|uniref:Reelin domain-containing protein n=1 Tax=Pinctada imbricata TaxID=66713 RepID=A0AA88YNV0_PINIB|nr:hypothetical protein FSP39_016847 [Pinctada imbricata]